MIRLTAAGLMAVAIWQLGGAALIHAKAWLAPVLIERAWRAGIATHRPVKPWPWADTVPIARLDIPSLGLTRYVLAGANGGSLPFGPGHLQGSALPGDPGSVIIAAHRDTHFRNLDQLRPGAGIKLTTRKGRTYHYEVTAQEIVDARVHQLMPSDQGSGLILITCHPTSDFAYRGPFRLVVTARAI